MNKGRFLFAFAILLVFVYAALLVFNFNSLSNQWFSFVLLFIGAYSLLYSHLYGLDSYLYYGTLLLLLGLTTYIRSVNNIPLGRFYPIYILAVSLSHLSVFVKFRQNIHFKLFAILLVQGILLVSFKFKVVSLKLALILSLVLWLMVFINIVYRLKRNLRRE